MNHYFKEPPARSIFISCPIVIALETAIRRRPITAGLASLMVDIETYKNGLYKIKKAGLTSNLFLVMQ
jgi:hypothetical protein